MNNVKQNSLKAWFLAARPKTLTGAATPVIVGLAAAEMILRFEYNMHINLVPAALCLLFAFVMQIDANFINDYYDFLKGTDREDRLGPERACAQGWVSMEAMRNAIALNTVLGCLCGLPLIVYGGLEMIIVGLLCVVFCFLYTTCMSYLGLGDLLVLLFFGLVPVCATFYIQLHLVNMSIIMLSLAVGFVVDTLLIVNNYRDIEQDKKSGKNTLITKIGKKWGGRLYLILGFVGVALAFVGILKGPSYVGGEKLMIACLPILYLCLHILTWAKMMRIDHGKELNKVLGATARNIFIFGILTAASLLLTFII